MTRITAYAKVTLSLRVLGRRADGYHDLEALTVSVSEPRDELDVFDAPQTRLVVDGPFADGVPSDDTNLVWRALNAVGHTKRVTLHKGVPSGAGLGGGSSDAAAILAAFGGTEAQAAALGADVPFCLQRFPAWMRGRGEIIDPVSGLAPLELVIVAPDFGCSTPAVYRAWDDLGEPRCEREIAAPPGYPGPFVNDLEPAAERVQPHLRAFREQLEATLDRRALLCGSGSAYAAWFDTADAAGAAAGRARVAFGPGHVWRAQTVHG